MEDILHLYRLPYDSQRSLICFDELPVQLLDEVVTPLPMKTGKPERVDYEYERGGTCSVKSRLRATHRKTLGRDQQTTHESRLLPLHATGQRPVPRR